MVIEDRVYDFQEELAWSHEDEKVFDAVYAKIFDGNYDRTQRVEDLALQKHGIDAFIYLKDGMSIRVDEKKDKRERANIFIEEWSDYEREKRGWFYTSRCDAIVYCIWPSKRFFWLPLRSMRRAFHAHFDEWHNAYRSWTIQNKSWYAVGIGIPQDVILATVEGSREIRL